MSNAAEGSRTVLIERSFQHSPEKVWRALTESKLLAQWLMNNDFAAVVERKFQFRAGAVPGWDGIIECEVLILEPLKRLSYTWRSMGLDSIVLFTLTPVEGGTHLRMEHTGFRADHKAAYQGATYGWQKFLGALEGVLDGGLR